MENSLRIVGIDYGDARVGVAVCDPSGFLASAVCTVEVRGLEDAAEKLAAKVDELAADMVVIGMPKNMDGSLSFRAEKTERFAKKLAAKISLDIEFMDERLTTAEAYTYMNIAGFNGKKRKNVIDALSAKIILQSFIDSPRGKELFSK